eukprot:scaffold28929_cov29-Prasinocladus_malaysianus.AAC.2
MDFCVQQSVFPVRLERSADHGRWSNRFSYLDRKHGHDWFSAMYGICLLTGTSEKHLLVLASVSLRYKTPLNLSPPRIQTSLVRARVPAAGDAARDCSRRTIITTITRKLASSVGRAAGICVSHQMSASMTAKPVCTAL